MLAGVSTRGTSHHSTRFCLHSMLHECDAPCILFSGNDTKDSAGDVELCLHHESLHCALFQLSVRDWVSSIGGMPGLEAEVGKHGFDEVMAKIAGSGHSIAGAIDHLKSNTLMGIDCLATGKCFHCDEPVAECEMEEWSLGCYENHLCRRHCSEFLEDLIRKYPELTDIRAGETLA